MSITNADHLCINCMREKPDGGVCPFCGFDEAQYEPSPHHLPPRSILGGKCLVGRVLGEGGFGITYMGWDLNLDLKLAIKEYYPAGFVTRTGSATNTVTPYRGEKTEFFSTGRSRFINEAKTLAKFYTLPGIVSVRDFFLENGTAYILMEFVEGETLKQRLARVGGRMDAVEVFELVRPLLRSLAEMHASGLIHRDISPDNIMITPENNVKLIDFGAARDYLDSGNRSLSVMLKPGFAPEEQYFARGQQGPWTDIYALSATIYRAITGTTPPESVERLRHDELKAPSALGVRISPAQEAALLKGMAVSQEERWQTIPELSAALYGAEGKRLEPVQPAKQANSSANEVQKQERDVTPVSKQSENEPTSDDVPDGKKVWFKKTKGVMNVAYAGLAIFVVVAIVLLINGFVIHQKTKRIETFLEAKNFDLAIALIEEIDADTAVYDNALYQAAQELLDAGEFENATIAKNKIVDTEKQDMESLEDQIAYQQAVAFLENGDFLSADKALDTIKRPEKYHVETMRTKVADARIRNSFANGDFANAISDLISLRMSNRSAAETLIDDYLDQIYNHAVSLYRSKFFDLSAESFRLISSDYQQTEGYLQLIQAHNSLDAGTFIWDWADKTDGDRLCAQELMATAGWEDTGEILMSGFQPTVLFLLGRWSHGSSYFQIKSASGLYDDLWGYWNLTGFPSGSWTFEDGEFEVKNSAGDYVKIAKFSIVDKNTIQVYVYSKTLTYTLYRN